MTQDNTVEREIRLHRKETVMQDIFVSKDQRDPNQLIKSLEVFALRVDSVPVELLVHLGAMMEISIFLREAKVLQIASNAGEVTYCKG